jgi:ATP-dependent Clp protease ATP-binding subunit ClpC
LIKVENSQASQVLHDLGIRANQVRDLIGQLVGYGTRTRYSQDQIDLTPQFKLLIKSAISKARQRRHTYVDTSHLLLGLVEQESSIAIDILHRLGVAPKDVQKNMIQTMEQASTETASAPSKKIQNLGTGTTCNRPDRISPPGQP